MSVFVECGTAQPTALSSLFEKVDTADGDTGQPVGFRRRLSVLPQPYSSGFARQSGPDPCRASPEQRPRPRKGASVQPRAG